MRITTATLAATLTASSAFAMFAMVPADRVDEVPVERLLTNLETNAQKLSEAERQRAIGRIHLLAYLRAVASLPVYRDRPGAIAEGKIGDCAELDEQTIGKGNRDNFPPAKPGERCEARTYSLGPQREIPLEAFDVRRASFDAHLRASIEAYTRARALEPGNLRTHLALAFAYDRAGRLNNTRAELRFILTEGLKRIPAPANPGEVGADWETHTVVNEGVEHFDRVVKRWSDKHLIARTKKRLAESQPARYVTPIVVPLKSDAAFEDLTDKSSPVAFDFLGQGHMMKAGWLTNDAAWLVWDPKAKGRVTSGFQLFGSVTWIASWDNGYKALGALDDNGDGKISGPELEGLALWQDKNGDGKSDDGEVKPITAYKVTALTYDHKKLGDNLWIATTGVTFEDGETRPTYDWILHEGLVTVAN